MFGNIFLLLSNSKVHFEVNSGDTNQMQHSLASDLGLHCLHMSHKKDARLIWVKELVNKRVIPKAVILADYLCRQHQAVSKVYQVINVLFV